MVKAYIKDGPRAGETLELSGWQASGVKLPGGELRLQDHTDWMWPQTLQNLCDRDGQLVYGWTGEIDAEGRLVLGRRG